jgi:hypothetical protein
MELAGRVLKKKRVLNDYIVITVNRATKTMKYRGREKRKEELNKKNKAEKRKSEKSRGLIEHSCLSKTKECEGNK